MKNQRKISISEVKDFIDALEKSKLDQGEPINGSEILEDAAKVVLPLERAWSVFVFSLKHKITATFRINFWKFKKLFIGGKDE